MVALPVEGGSGSNVYVRIGGKSEKEGGSMLSFLPRALLCHLIHKENLEGTGTINRIKR